MDPRTPLPPRRFPPPSGWSHAGQVDPRTGLWTPSSYGENTRLHTWGHMACRSLGLGDRDYRIAAAYIEYANVDDPDDVATVPEVGRGDGLDYYEGLPEGRDFLRVPLTLQPAISVLPGHEAYFAPGQGNVLTVFVQTAGTSGALGRPFSHTVNSKVVGVALVATPVPGDRTHDVLFSRMYYAGDAESPQVPKLPSGQVGIQYSVPFAIAE